MRKHSPALLFATLTLTLASAAEAVPIVRSIGGTDNPASIQAVVDQFRADLGNPNNGSASGPLFSGRREINWDGGGATNGTAPVTPFNTFLNRGGQFTTPGTGLQQGPLTGGTFSLDLINPTYGETFQPFSNLRLFFPVGSNITDAVFSIPNSGGSLGAAVRGFGAVFTDVDEDDTTSIEFFGFEGTSRGKFFVLAGTTEQRSLSFLGVSFTEGSIISRVRITTGDTALGPADGSGVDVVVMDDFLFGEPRRIPEPALWLLIATGLAGLCLARRKR